MPQGTNPPYSPFARRLCNVKSTHDRLLDTSKLVHIWYTTITASGWSVLEFNDSSVAIGICKVDLFSA